MNTCHQCGTQNELRAQYCDECGTALLQAGRAAIVSNSFKAQDKNITGTPPLEAVRLVDVKANFDGRGEAGDGSQQVSAPRERHAVHTRTNGESQKFAVAPPHAKLVIQRGESAGKGFLIRDDEAYIGRWDADGGIFPDIDLDADDPEAKVSRRHARIIKRADGYFVEDLGSTNGTFVNRGRRLLPGSLQPLADGDEIIVGKTFMRLYIIQ